MAILAGPDPAEVGGAERRGGLHQDAGDLVFCQR